MSQFNSAHDYWEFARAVKTKQRYFRTPEIERFLEAVRRTAEPRIHPVPIGWKFWRAQLGNCVMDIEQDGHTYEEAAAYPSSRMKPPLDKGPEGRVNAKGIPCLYGATTRETAMAEVRPWVGAYVSVGVFIILSDLRIVDCSKFHARSPFSSLLERPIDHVPSPEEIDKDVWTWIDNAFSEPVTESDDVPDYVPTQILAELFKKQGYGGIAYKSKLTEDGFNVAFFDPGIAKQVYGCLHRVEKVKFEFSEHPDDEYWIKDKGDAGREVVTNLKPAPPRNKAEP